MLAEAQSEYRVFELGFNAENKKKIVEGQLSEAGKMYSLRPGAIFVTDQPEVLERIEELLNDLQGQLAAQIRLSLRRGRSGEERKKHLDVGVKIHDQGGSIKLSLGDEKKSRNETTLTQLTTLSGERAVLRLETSEGRLRYWRSYFLPSIEKVSSESEVLEIRPVLSGQRVKATIYSLYVARVKGKEMSFKAGELQSQVILHPVQWISLGGLRSQGEEAKRRNFGLSRAGEKRWEDLQIEVKAEVIPPHRVEER